jgi:hypothetical protein
VLVQIKIPVDLENRTYYGPDSLPTGSLVYQYLGHTDPIPPGHIAIAINGSYYGPYHIVPIEAIEIIRRVAK